MAIKKPGQTSPDNREPAATTPRIEMVSLDKLRPYENNARTHSPEQVDKLRASLREFGFVNPILIDSDYGIIAGHGRLMAAQAEGMASVPCVFVEHLTETQKRAYILADNKLAELAGWDEGLLEQELGRLSDIGFDVSRIGFDMEKLDDVDLSVAEDDEFDVDLPQEPRSRRGCVYMLGNHRLMCGDSTSTEDIGVLMDGVVADLLVTDPPYNVAYESDDGKSIQNDDMASDEFYKFLLTAFAGADRAMRDGAVFYIWHASSSQMLFEKAINDAGWGVRQQLIWLKNALVLGRQDYHWIHEPCFYGWKPGAAHYFIYDRTQTTKIWEDAIGDIDDLDRDALVGLIKMITEGPSTIIRESKPSRSDEHPTMKPIKLIERLVKNSSNPGDVVLDLFGGSGTTLVTCEQINRKCYMMELDEKYCDVIISRWEKMTGQAAVEVDIHG